MTVEGDGSGHVHGLDQVGAGIFDAAGRWDAEPAIRGTVVPVLHVEAGSGLTDLDRFAGVPAAAADRSRGRRRAQPDAGHARPGPAMIARFIDVGLDR